MTQDKSSLHSLIEATRSRAKFSGHGKSLGAAGERHASFDPGNCIDLREPGQSIAISPGEDGFESILIGAAWDNTHRKKSSLLGRLFGKTRRGKGVDLDIGCLYELADGTRGAIQAFGEKFGAYDSAPHIALSGDHRTGDGDGHDEYLLVNGAHWDKIRRLMVYIYIYDGAPRWSQITPRILVDVPGEDDLCVTLAAHKDALCLCAVAGLENVRGGIKLTNYTEYFHGHQEMDRAFGFGLDWGDGAKG